MAAPVFFRLVSLRPLTFLRFPGLSIQFKHRNERQLYHGYGCICSCQHQQRKKIHYYSSNEGRWVAIVSGVSRHPFNIFSFPLWWSGILPPFSSSSFLIQHLFIARRSPLAHHILDVNDVWQFEIFPRLEIEDQTLARLVSVAWYKMASKSITLVKRRQNYYDENPIHMYLNIPRLPNLKKLVFYQAVSVPLFPFDLGDPVILARLEWLVLIHTSTLLDATTSRLSNLTCLELHYAITRLLPLRCLPRLRTLVMKSCFIIDRIPQADSFFAESLEVVYSQRTHYYSNSPLAVFSHRVQALCISIHTTLDPVAVPLQTHHLVPLIATLTELVLIYHTTNFDAFEQFDFLTNLVHLRLLDTPHSTPMAFSIPPSLQTLSIFGEWVVSDDMCATFSELQVLVLNCNLEYWKVGLSRLTRLRRLVLVSPSELHSRLLPPCSDDLVSTFRTFYK